jgi:uncharacterized membrane protein YkoI
VLLSAWESTDFQRANRRLVEEKESMKTTKLLLTASAGLAFDAAAQATEEREPVELSSLPAAVQKTIKEHAAGGQIISIEKENDDGKWNYEVTVKTKGKEWGFEVDERGKFLKKHDDQEKEEKE